MKIGFIGLGNMGAGMAANILRYCEHSGDSLTVLDLNQAVVEKFVGLGARRGASVQDIAQNCELIFTSLPSSKQVAQVAFGAEGILENALPGAVWIETSTSELAEWEKVRAAAPASLTLIDGPVTGGAEGAAAGTLTMLLGAEETQLEALRPVLESFTKRAVRMGPAGAGYATKLIQLHLNYLVAQGIGEALMLGTKANLDLDTLHGVLQNSCAQSYVVDRYIPMVLDGSYDPSFALGLATKDMRLITGLGEYLDVDLTLARKVYETYQVATAEFGEDAPHLSVVKLIENSGKTLLRSTASQDKPA
uniref:NAD(P)-dependent oxidoreductase n=1 Tax=Marinobacterium profundum TaxID=1714300 RepID=UPI00082A5FAD|nr:NAD(P)-dependent oxidoreductase [Marinobacterium profundum]